MTTGRSLRIGEGVLSLGVLALGLFIAVQTALLEVGPSQAAVGPSLFPSLIAIGLIAVGVSLLREAFFGHIAHERGWELDWRAVALVSAGLVAADAAAREPGLDHCHHASVPGYHPRLRQPASCCSASLSALR